MGCLSVVVWVLAAIGALKILRGIKRRFFGEPPVPKVAGDWWGPRDKASEDEGIKPFKVEVSDEVLNDLKHRLSHARPFTPPLEGINHQYGLNTNLLEEVVEFWRTQYDWREREKFLNQFPQFTVSVQGLRLHYLHVKPANPDGLKVLPLLILHGWPGSVREFYDLIPFLTTPQKGRSFVFEVIAPSLPGYGFSEAAVRPGLGPTQIAVLFKNLMAKLGFEKYYVQGGDWGALIIRCMAVLFPEKILGLHSNMLVVNSLWSNVKLFFYSFYPSLIVQEKYKHRLFPLSKRYASFVLETGFLHIQATKPDTVGVALNDSPVGLAAYILEKFITVTNPDFRDNRQDGGLAEKFGYTKLLDNVMIYWVTNSITTSVRLYAEAYATAQRKYNLDKFPSHVPTACASFVHDLFYTPAAFVKSMKNVIHHAEYEGGHFAALELPQTLAGDIYDGIEKIQLFSRNKQ